MSGDLDRRLTALAEAVEVADGRLDPELVAAARGVTLKAGARLGLGIEKTVVALAGPTGAGKSTLFNALTGTDLAAVGRRRPTTSTGQAAAWGEGADALLDWLQVPRRHRLDAGGMDGLVLLDLPDFDSVEASHRVEVDRVVALADLVVWVADPQKYADASLHDRYLRPLASHAAAMAVVLNQADLLPAAQVEEWRRDMERLLASDGLTGVPVEVVSGRTGDGVGGLRALLAERVAARDAAVARLAADVGDAARAFAAACAGGNGARVGRRDRDRLTSALAEAAGVPHVVHAVAAAHRRRGVLATGMPFVRWVRRFRPDPLRRLRLGDDAPAAGRTSVPAPTDVQRAQVGTAARRVADAAGEGLAPPWPILLRERVATVDDVAADRLDRAVGAADLHTRPPRWWTAAGALQKLLALAVAAGLLWLLVLAVLGYLRIDDVVPLPEVRGVPIPTWLVVGGLAAAVVLALLARIVNGAAAARRARAAGRALRERVAEVGDDLVIAPVEAELDAHERFCAAVATAAGNR